MNVQSNNSIVATNKLANSQQGQEEVFKQYPLPHDFVPGDNDIIIGRGKKCYSHVGNRRLAQTVNSKMDEYIGAKCKLEKSQIISSIVAQIRSSGHFVKEDPNVTGLWFDVDDVIAREKIAQAFRNAPAGNYKSSSRFKLKRRLERKRELAIHHREAFKLQQYVERMYTSRLERNFEVESQIKTAIHHSRPSCESVDIVKVLSSLLPARCLEDDNPYEPLPILETENDHCTSLNYSL